MTTLEQTIYQQKGYKNRREYLEELADNYTIERITVFVMADMLGPEEDFDGLVRMIEKYSEGDK